MFVDTLRRSRFIDFETCHRIDIVLSKLDYCNVHLNGLAKKSACRSCKTNVLDLFVKYPDPITSHQALTNFIASQSQTALSSKLFPMFLNLFTDSLHFTLTRA